MKRSRPPRRSAAPIGRTARLKSSRKPIAPRKKDPAKRRFAKRRCQPFLDWLLEQPCCITGKRTGEWMGVKVYDRIATVRVSVHAAHVRARGAGGYDLWNAVPLATDLHSEQHITGFKTFWKKYGLDPVVIAKEHTERFLALHPEFRGAHPGWEDGE